jgi:membrane-bound lytic murein transglycosylase MltF
MPLYVPFIEEKLAEKNLPDDLKYLPIAESALRNDVVSSAGAAGIWQFMPETAKQYGLIVNENIDERYHFEKSTLAALEYLEDLHKKF